MLSSDDSYIYSSSITITQDLILPFFKKTRDMRNLFRELQARTVDDLDNGMVLNGVAMADVEKFSKLENK